MDNIERSYDEIVITLNSMYAAEQVGERQLVLESKAHSHFVGHRHDGEAIDFFFDRLPELLASGTLYSFTIEEEVVDPLGVKEDVDGEVTVFAHGITDVAAIPETEDE